ncbi:AAA family ATPase [Micromonospora sp. NPDC048170]|uniref:helix-turn-helix transcriptional regulator n=1 Tax=Micromonospora sp. NPDC048170 TaxID=3154819 RepID=UPI00340C3318
MQIRRSISGEGRVSALSAPAFVGRERELAALGSALAEPPFVVLLEGEAGVGKSRLLREFLESAVSGGHRSLVGVCPPLREPYTLGPVVDAIREATDTLAGPRLSGLAGALRPLFPEWAADLPAAPDPLPDPSAARHRLFRALVELIGWLDVTVLVLDDMHWADEATIEFLLFVLSRPQPPVNVVVTYRPGEVPEDGMLRRLSSRLPSFGLRLRLDPLSTDETAAFVSSMLAEEPVSGEFAAALWRGTAGLPLALEETVRLMYDRADLVRRRGEWMRRPLAKIDVPPAIRDAVLERVVRLDADTRTVLNAAAVLGDPSGQGTLAAVAGLSDERFAAGLVGALASGLLTEDPRGLVSYHHGLVCRTIYEKVPSPERRHRHLLAGRVLESVTPVPAIQLVRHFRESDQRDDCCRYVERAVAMCRLSGDEITASNLLHRLLTSFVLPVGELVRFVTMLSGVTRWHQVADVIRVLESALLGEGLTGQERADLHFQLARLHRSTSNYREVRRQMAQVVEDLPADSYQALRSRLFLAVAMGDVRPAAEHLRWLRETVIPAALTPEQRLVVAVDRVLASVLLGQESDAWDDVRLLPERPTNPSEANIVAVIRKNVAEATMHWGRYEEARDSLARAIHAMAEHELPGAHAMTSVTQARLDWLTGRWDGLAERLQEFIEDEAVPSEGRSEAALLAGWLHTALGHDAAAEQYLLAARQDGERRNATDLLVESTVGLAALRVSAGDFEAALLMTEEPVEITVDKGIWMWGALVLPVRTQALIGAGRATDADALIAALENVVGEANVPGVRAAIVLCRAFVAQAKGNPVQAASLFGRAARAFDRLPQPYLAALSREQQAGCLLACGREETGRALLAEALDACSRLGVAHRPAPVRRPGRPSYGDQLSPRERDVVRLVIDGQTNQQIAAALVVSRQTVVSHLQSAMRKLRVNSRTALAVKAVEEDLVNTDEEIPGRDEKMSAHRRGN